MVFSFSGLFIVWAFSSVASAQTATCSASAPGGLCVGISNSALCSTSVMADCSDFPRCNYIGWLPGYVCRNHCHDTQQQGSCGPGQVCLCVDQNPCALCTYGGQDLSACNDNGCGGADTQLPSVTITSPTNLPSFASSVSPIALEGTAFDNTTVSRVEWFNNRNDSFVGGSGTASGTDNWMINFVNLEPGENVITVKAVDGAGNEGEDTITVSYNIPVSQNFPAVAVAENPTAYSVSISDSDELSEVAYAWGEKPNIYFLLPFANGDNPVLSAMEQERYNYLAANFANDWDRLTENRLPLKLNFLAPFTVSAYSRNENDWFNYVTKTIDQFETDNSGSLNFPAIYVFLYPEPYFNRTFASPVGSAEKRVLAEVHFGLFNDTSMTGYSSPYEIISNVMQHELAHCFAMLPNNVNFPPGDDKYFWLSHPAGFSGIQSSCDEETSLMDCDPYGAADSPTGTDGYYEAYSILSLARSFVKKQNFGNRDPELSPLEEMAMGLRSRHDDANFMYYEGYLSGSVDDRRFNLVAPHDYNISSKRLYDYTVNPDNYHALYWNISYDNTKNVLPISTRSFSVPKASQSSRPLIVYAKDALNPGYFKVFSNNAHSETYASGLDLATPAAPTGLTAS
ncbi:MAG: hypothetical protein QG620_308 [Patescibacteria group bacterium]|nr:hypothetical protein [Patescibacteria group bacterium]